MNTRGEIDDGQVDDKLRTQAEQRRGQYRVKFCIWMATYLGDLGNSDGLLPRDSDLETREGVVEV